MSRETLLEDIEAQANVFGQELDEAVVVKLDELSEQQLAKLYDEFQDRARHADERPIRNVSALLVSLARGLLSGRIAAESAVPKQRTALAALTRGIGAEPARGQMVPVPLRTTRAAAKASAVEELLAQAGVAGVDDQALQKIGELTQEDQVALVEEFQVANAAENIMSPSKWLFARARTALVQQKKAGAGTPRFMVTGGQEIPELPGVVLDNECIEKMAELEADERAEVIQEYHDESLKTDIRNPSSWLYSRSRARIVVRVTGGRAPPRSGGPVEKDQHAQTYANLQPANDPFRQLQEIGVDDQAITKCKELSPGDLQTLLLQFVQLYSQGQINDPSKWLFAKARSIAAKISQEQRKAHVPGREPLAFDRGSAPSGGSLWDAGGSVWDAGEAAVLEGNVPELKGVTLDEKALSKLEELESEERASLFIEYAVEASRKPILNPSGWVYGRARTKVCDRLTGKGRPQRASPY